MSRAPLLLLLAGCGGREPVYAACEEPADCVVPEEAEAECLDKEGQGFCTWACAADADCADAPDDSWPLVCASFEDAAGTYCFPACDEDPEAEEEDEDVCPSGYTCRSTGGGADNRRVCFPDAG